jgi:Gpi18-like mannosyltransferase
MNFTKFKHLFLLLGITLFSTLLFWGAFYFHIPSKIGMGDVSMETIWANYDGPNYLAIAKCGYNRDCLRQNFALPMPLEYYPAHFPGFPALIYIFDNLGLSGPNAMLAVTLLSSLFLTIISYLFFNLFFSNNKSFILSFILLFFPARLFILRQIGSPEPLFLASILASIYFFKNKKYFISALFVALTQSLKSPGIILFIAFGLHWLLTFIKTKQLNFAKYAWYLLTPILIFGIFNLYYLQTGDFWAYFHSGDNIHLSFIPYSVFMSHNVWIDTVWLEDVIYIFGIALVALFSLYHRFKSSIIFIFPLLFTVATIFVGHRDISRYISPVYPFIILSLGKYLTKKRILLVFILLLPAVIFYSLNFVAGNAAPISNWAPYL